MPNQFVRKRKRPQDSVDTLSAICGYHDKTLVFAQSVDVARLLSKKDSWVLGNRTCIGFRHSSANRLVSPGQFDDLAKTLKPDVVVIDEPSKILFDEINHGTNAIMEISANSLQKKRYRWLKWLKTYVDLNDGAIPFFLGIGGDSFLADRIESSKAVAQICQSKDVGFVTYLPTPRHPDTKTMAIWVERLSATFSHLPPSAPRMVLGVQSASAIAIAVQNGVDLFDNQWISGLSISGHAILLRFDTEFNMASLDLPPLGIQTNGKYELLLNMNHQDSAVSSEGSDYDRPRNGIWRTDFRPLCPDCKCSTCKSPHTRAYIYHLLIVKDMLAYILLMHHNTHQLAMFMESIRVSIQDGTMDAHTGNWTESLVLE